MIPKRIPRKPQNDNYRALALYAADAKSKEETGEKALMHWHEGCLSESYHGGLIEVEATQAMNTRTTKEKTYHLMVSFRPEDEAKLSPEIFQEMEKEFAKALGYSEHQRHCGVHKNTDNLHMHIAYNMIHPATFNRHEPFRDYPKLHQVCRDLEKRYRLKIDKGIEGQTERERPGSGSRRNTKAQTIEAQTGQQSLHGYVIGQREKVLAALERSTSWENFQTAILKLGLELKLRGNGLVLKDRHGRHAVKVSALDRNLSKAKLEKIFGPFLELSEQRKASVKSLARYTAAPLHSEAERENLFTVFKTEMAQRKAALGAVAEREKSHYQAHKNKWAEKKKIIARYPMTPADKKRLLEQLKLREEMELAAGRLSLNEQKKTIREAIPYTNWTKFLQHKAALGNEAALTILRSKKIEPDPGKNFRPDSKIEAASTLEAKRNFSERQIEILANRNISRKHQRALISVARMQELMKKDPDLQKIGFDPEHMKYRIDTKGVVIFFLKSGGSIRDTGSAIHFSAHDSKAKELAEKFAAMKWGRIHYSAESQISRHSNKSPNKSKSVAR